MSAMLDWANGLSGPLDSQQDWVKAEFCWLASLTDSDHPVVQGLTWADGVFQMFGHRFLPQLVERPKEVHGLGIECDYAQALHRGGQMPAYEWDRSYMPLLAHQIMFHTDFGRIPFRDEALVNLLAASSGTPEWTNECRIALHFMGEPTQPIPTPAPTSWRDYHPALVAAILEALVR